MFSAALQSRKNKGDDFTVPSKDEAETKNDMDALDLPRSPPDLPPLTNDSKELDPSLHIWDFQSEYGGDVYTVEWEGALLLKLSQVVSDMAQKAASKATQEVLKTTALASIVTAVAFPLLLVNLANAIDNEWALVNGRSDMAGVELAKSLLQSDEERPVNLLGMSFGGRVVVACLEELARHQAIWEEQRDESFKDAGSGKDNKLKRVWKKKHDTDNGVMKYKREPASIVQDVIIMGTPLFVSRSSLRLCRRMVAGRFVNCYSRKDWILSLMFQYKNPNALKRGVCGTGPITGLDLIENYDVSGMVSSWHPNYCRAVPEILDFVGFPQPSPIDVS